MVRVGMTNPPYIKEHLDAMSDILNHPRVYGFLHIPVQSGSNPVLLNMRREYTIEEFKKVCDHLLRRVPDLTIATDIICGFPYETPEQFDETMELIDHYKFAVVNISKFYSRPGTEAAKMKKVSLSEAKARSTRLSHLFNGYRCYDSYQDTVKRVWVFENDEKCDENLVGHTKGYVKVLIKKQDGVDLRGKQVIVKITSTHKWHICGDILELTPRAEPVPENYFEECLRQRKEDSNKIQIGFEKIVEDRDTQESDNSAKGESPRVNAKPVKSAYNPIYEKMFGYGLMALGSMILYSKLNDGIF
jgi:radical SAM superfamily enzyme YgiQ (UPF0313 family)